MANRDDFRQVFVLLDQTVLARCEEVFALFAFVLGNHLLAAAAVPGQGKGRHRIIGRNDAGFCQGL